MKKDRKDKIKGGMLGLIIGDALGVPYEFRPPEEIPKWEEIEYVPPKGFHSSYQEVKSGTWSDDSAQALCLLDSLFTCGEFNLEDFSNKLLLWLRKGYWAVDHIVFDCGVQTLAALREFELGRCAEQCGLINPNGKGNGALMRVLPLALWHKGSNEELIIDAHKQCLITHGHVCNQVCSALYCLWARYILENINIREAYERAVKDLTIYYETSALENYLYELKIILQDGNFSGGGFVVDSIRSVKHLLFTYSDYESVVKGAISLGNDTDTTAAIAGGLAGLYYGYSSIPLRFLSNLREFEKVERFIERVLLI